MILNSETHLTRATSESVRTEIEMVVEDHPDHARTVDPEAEAEAGITEFYLYIRFNILLEAVAHFMFLVFQDPGEPQGLIPEANLLLSAAKVDPDPDLQDLKRCAVVELIQFTY